MGPHAQIISVSTISAAHARILLVPLQLIPQTVALVKDVLFHEITSIGKTYANMLDMLSAWAEQAKKLEAGEITREDYDRWRYNYPKYDTTLRWAKVPSQELSDFLVDALKDSPDTDE